MASRLFALACGVDHLEFFLDDLPVGRVEDHNIALLEFVLPTAQVDGEVMRWKPGATDPSVRSMQIQSAALALCRHGAIRGWRNELYRCEQPVSDPCREFGAELFALERAAFRFFGLMSRAVHVNGLLADGSVWCGRRSAHKAIDPGRLDSLAAGGLGAGEDVVECARRELFEEAGVPPELSMNLEARGAVRTRRQEAEGWHDEVLHVFDLVLPQRFVPDNRDGEVCEFLLLGASDVMKRTGELTLDAAAALLHSLHLSR
jgi:8-oxo-dGTP pyrophosphatase MutT (NUDIX family)